MRTTGAGLAIGETPRWRNRIPVEIVRIFERHGFIWGGAWYHYDTMHFEYRPELLPRRLDGAYESNAVHPRESRDPGHTK